MSTKAGLVGNKRNRENMRSFRFVVVPSSFKSSLPYKSSSGGAPPLLVLRLVATLTITPYMYGWIL